jgi:hypothetical protein
LPRLPVAGDDRDQAHAAENVVEGNHPAATTIYYAMKALWLFGFLIILVMFAVIGFEPITDQWTAIHSSEGIKETAANLCGVEHPALGSTEGKTCYKSWLAALSRPQSTWR